MCADVSYCQPGPHRWPASGNWGHLKTFSLARSLGHDRGGEFAHIYDFEPFYCTLGGEGADTRPPGIEQAQEERRAYREQVTRMTGGRASVGAGNDMF